MHAFDAMTPQNPVPCAFEMDVPAVCRCKNGEGLTLLAQNVVWKNDG